MNTIAALLLGLAAASARPAHPPATIRTNVVYTWARAACPKNHELANHPRNQHLEFLSGVAKDAHLTNEEGDLLVLMCFIYDEGAQGAYKDPLE